VILLFFLRSYFNQGRPHFSLGPRIPEPAAVFLACQGHDRHSFAQDCKVAARAVLGGLANALSALYPEYSEEKRLLDAMRFGCS